MFKYLFNHPFSCSSLNNKFLFSSIFSTPFSIFPISTQLIFGDSVVFNSQTCIFPTSSQLIFGESVPFCSGLRRILFTSPLKNINIFPKKVGVEFLVSRVSRVFATSGTVNSS
jgi:hypothetical protein